VSLRQLLRTLILVWWALAGTLALSALFIFPVMKGVMAGLLPVIVGVVAAISLRLVPVHWKTRSTERLAAIPDRLWLAGVCLLAFLLRLPGILSPALPTNDGDTFAYLADAKSLAAGNGIPNILFPPGQAAWLALWVSRFGDNLQVLALAQTILTLGAIVILYAVLKNRTIVAARWGTLVIAAMPSLVLFSSTLGHETTDMFSQVAILATYLLGIQRERTRGSVLIWPLLGVIAGLAALVHPTFLVVPILVGFNLWLMRVPLLRCLTPVLLTGLAAAMVVLPWSLRNYRHYGHFSAISANFGRTLLEANQSGSLGVYSNISSFISTEPNPVLQDRMAFKEALRVIHSDPLRFFYLCGRRTIYMWGTDTSMLEFVLGDPPHGGTVRKALLSVVIQTFWAWLVCAWCLSGWISLRSKSLSPEDLWCVTSIGVIWLVHGFLVEGLSRHHLSLIPLIAVTVLPSYLAWVRSSRSTAIAKEAQLAGSRTLAWR